MKLLLDQNISFRLIKILSQYFSDVQSVKENNLQNADDLKIWEYAKQYGFAIVTFDEDFYNIQLLKGFPPKIIWFKTGNLRRKQLEEFLIAKREIISAFIEGQEYKEEGCLEFYLISK